MTQQLPTDDRYLMTRGELEARIDVLFGGRAAEEVVFGEISTGAHNDLERATDIVRSMVLEYGMSDTLGPMTFPRRPRPASSPITPGSCPSSASTARPPRRRSTPR